MLRKKGWNGNTGDSRCFLFGKRKGFEERRLKMGMESKGDRRIGNAENTRGSGKIFLSCGRGEKVEEAGRVTVAVHGVWYNIFTVNGNHKSQGGIKNYRKAEGNVSDALELCVWIFMKMTGFSSGDNSKTCRERKSFIGSGTDDSADILCRMKEKSLEQAGKMAACYWGRIVWMKQRRNRRDCCRSFFV